jgi:hypothetical protein
VGKEDGFVHRVAIDVCAGYVHGYARRALVVVGYVDDEGNGMRGLRYMGAEVAHKAHKENPDAERDEQQHNNRHDDGCLGAATKLV